jgi:hypothetical protein
MGSWRGKKILETEKSEPRGALWTVDGLSSRLPLVVIRGHFTPG